MKIKCDYNIKGQHSDLQKPVSTRTPLTKRIIKQDLGKLNNLICPKVWLVGVSAKIHTQVYLISKTLQPAFSKIDTQCTPIPALHRPYDHSMIPACTFSSCQQDAGRPVCMNRRPRMNLLKKHRCPHWNTGIMTILGSQPSVESSAGHKKQRWDRTSGYTFKGSV